MNNKNYRYLGLHKLSHKKWLNQLAKSKHLEETIDNYNQGPLIEKIETKVAHLFGKEKALFFHKGTIAQLAALKVVAENKKNNKIIIHPKSHIANDEKEAYKFVTHLEAELIGENDKPFTFAEVSQVNAEAASLVIELPLRRVGFKLTSWDELRKMQQWSSINNIHFHMDGARLWESTHYYQKSLAEISELFDSIYVSLYKGIGAIGGSLLVGDDKFIEKCKVWRSRLGGDAWTAFPSLITALDGIENTLPRIESWVVRAHEIANELSKIENLKVNTPATNGFLIFAKGDLSELNKKANELTEKTGLRLFNSFFQTDFSELCAAEVQVGQDHGKINTHEIIEYFETLINS